MSPTSPDAEGTMSTSGRSGRRVSAGSVGGHPPPSAAPPSGVAPHRVGSQASGPAPQSADGGIRGRVETPDREPVPAASVAVTAGPAHPDLAALTDDAGRFALPAGVPGVYAVTVHKAGYSPQTVRVDTTASGEVTVTLRPGR
ncbi:MAG: hypothetical protein C0501_30710 [Isosphaera sp.]|nr:hypothetical protein [Isosphaera sp.]